MNFIASCMASLPNTRAVGCLAAMMYCADKHGVAHCQQNGSVRSRQEAIKLGNNVALRNAMSAKSIG